MCTENEHELTRPADYMRFTLIYDGPLPAQSASNSRIDEKHDIRLQLHPQIGDLWASHPALREEYHRWKGIEDLHLGAVAMKSALIQPIQIGRSRFITLVGDFLSMTCELDVLFLRKEPRGYLVNQAGDLDNRIKVLFDALRVPKENELPATLEALPDPFFCLLEDDRLITSVRIVSERLLEGTIPTSRNHVRLVVNVTTQIHRMTAVNIGLS